MVYVILFFLLYFPFVGESKAQGAQTFIMGAGQGSCGKWIESKNTPQLHYQVKQWVLGFISGHNWAQNEYQVMPLDEHAVVAFMDQY